MSLDSLYLETPCSLHFSSLLVTFNRKRACMYAAVKKQQHREKKKRNKQDRTEKEKDKYKSKYSITHLVFTVELWLNMSCNGDDKETKRHPYSTLLRNT